MSTILVIEDDLAVRQGITDALTFSGYQVLSAPDGRTGLDLALTATYDLLLDLVLPHHSGFDILQALQTQRPGQAVIILSARGEENDRVKGLTLGADDYVVKPFSARELLARVNAVLRRSHERNSPQLDLTLTTCNIGLDEPDQEKSTHPCGTQHLLSQKESAILKTLLTNQGHPVTRDELLRHVWGVENKNIETRTIDMHIANLRKKLNDPDQIHLKTIRGKGYLLQP